MRRIMKLIKYCVLSKTSLCMSLILILLPTMYSCSMGTISKMVTENDTYKTMGWLNVIEGDKTPISGYSRLQDLMKISTGSELRNHINLYGLPDYIKVMDDTFELEMIYLKDGYVYTFADDGFFSLYKIRERVKYSDYAGGLPSEIHNELIKHQVNANMTSNVPVSQPSAPTPVPSIKTEKRIALVIGNSNYQDAPLKNPIYDANDLSNVLSLLGFSVMTRTNVNRQEMEQAINEFFYQMQNGDVALFYFSGHGTEIEGMNYLIPVREQIESASDIRYKAINAGYVLGKMEDSTNRTNIMILDACRNNPFKGLRAFGGGLTAMESPLGTFIAYATAPGTVAFDGTDRNGIYTKHLLKAMQIKGLPIEQVFKYVLRGVEEETSRRQIPWISSSLRNDFYFNP